MRYVKDARGNVVTVPPRLTQVRRQATVAAMVLAASLSLSTLTYAQGEPVRIGELRNGSQKHQSVRAPQEGSSSSVSGKILDINEAVMIGAKVTLRNVESGEIRITKSDDEGRYKFKDIEPGVFEIEVLAHGFATFVLKNLEIAESSVLEKDLVLEVAVMGDVVILERPVEPSEPQIETTIQGQRLIDLPINSRTTTLGLIAIAPEPPKTPKKKNKKLPK
jgi:hypothetical protein